MNLLKIITLAIFLISFSVFSQDKKVLSNLKNKLELIKLTNETKLFLKNKRLKEAEIHINQIYNLDSNSHEYYYLQGALEYCQKNKNSSIKNLQKSLELNPNHDLSYFLLGMIYALEHNWETAHKYLYKASLLSNYDPFYRLNLAVANYNMADYKQAIYESKKAIEYKQNFRNAKDLLVYSLIEEKQYKEALEYIEQLGKISAKSTLYLDYLHLLHEAEKDYQKIIFLLGNKNLKNHAKIRILASAYFHDGNYPKAIQTYQKLFSTNIVHEDDYLNYIKALIYSDKKNDANKVMSTVLSQGITEQKRIVDKYEKIQKEKEIFLMLYHPYPIVGK
ncbi:MAG: hypothetical protein H7A23_05745 [Leptospiraceae bacterium]|nr:hypothetical protein [Leptospiraceae bacterium]MCP5494041.1 hypothetical protein [Leptospiraceae bacterium]